MLKAYREHQVSPNGEYLARIYPKAKKALEYLIAQDAAAPGAPDDGLIENTQPNTYDIAFEGANTFVGSLYLAALRAGEEMAREAGDTAFADRAHALFVSGAKLTVERLWNGEYFVQQVDLAKFPKHQYGAGCLADQLFGQGWARQLGLGTLYPEAQCQAGARLDLEIRLHARRGRLQCGLQARPVLHPARRGGSACLHVAQERAS